MDVMAKSGAGAARLSRRPILAGRREYHNVRYIMRIPKIIIEGVLPVSGLLKKQKNA